MRGITDSEDSRIGTQIREYQILERIGRGGMGAVYRARHIYLDEERAIKLIQTDLVTSGEFVNRFIREARILAKLHHPNLVQLYEFGTLEDNTFFMVLELLRGESVLKRIQRLHQIPLPAAIRIIREAALGLNEAHKQGIIHRDLSPDNLILVRSESGDEITKVIDFGIAKPTARETQKYTRTNMFIGKVEYVSPEQCGLLQEGEEVDQRADIYSLGITFYQMLTGKLPFTSATPQGFLYKQINEIPRPVTSYPGCESYPPELDVFISRALAKRREDRHSSMNEVIEHLDHILSKGIETIQVPDWSPPALPQPGTLFAKRYWIEKKIGEGGMGTVYKATDKILDLPVAIKAINRQLTQNGVTLTRLKREVVLARKVAHPNVCRLFDIGEADGIPFVTMEFLEGETLSDKLAETGPFDPAEALPILIQVLEAIDAAHNQGIVHRDLKPQNVMIDSMGHVKIMDFGISFSAEAGHLTQSGMLIGTPRYMAPEQFSGSDVDQRADLYSFGIIMYELLAGRVPFDSRTPASMMYAHLNTPPPKPAQYVPGIHPELERIILKALEKDPAMRYQTTAELLSDLKRAAPEIILRQPFTPTQQLKPSPKAAPLTPVQTFPESETPKPQKSRSTIALLLGIIVLMIAGFAAYYYFNFVLPPEGSKIVAREQPPTQPEKSQPQQNVELQKPQPDAKSESEEIQESSQQIPLEPQPSETEPQQTPDEIAPAITAEVEPQIRTITVDSNPQGATILLDDRDTGMKTPAQLQVPTDNTHRLELRLRDYEPIQQNIGTDTLSIQPITLKPAQKPGTLSYEGEYEVSVFKDRVLLFNTDQRSAASLDPGQHRITIVSNDRKQAYIDLSQTIEIQPGQKTVVRQPQMANLNLTANPSNCTVFIGGKAVDIAPIFDYPLQSGNHKIRVVWGKLGREASGTITIRPGETKSLQAILSEDSAELFEEGNP